MSGSPALWSVGHSNRTADEFLELLASARIERLVDVRTVPRSRRNPQFDRDALAWSLERAGVLYRHEPDLGGLRRPAPDSPHTALREEGLRGYADHMDTPAFARAVERLIAEGRTLRTAVMCAEAEPERCHRSLLSDALAARGVRVVHVVATGREREHVTSPLARVRDGRVSYPGLL